MSTFVRQGASWVRERLKRPPETFKLYVPLVAGKSGLEIGGPSSSFRERDVLPLYQHAGSLDNCDFSRKTVWAEHPENFQFWPGKPPGKTIFCDGSQLDPVRDKSYDFLLSSHNLEHFANPVKALYEWKRVLRSGGALILILPHYMATFDHRRTPTPVADMIDDYKRNVGEDDLSHLPEILQQHDLTRDPSAGTFEEFRNRSLDNFNNRCLHQHVFDEHNSSALLASTGYKVLAVEVVLALHVCLLAQTCS